MKKNLISNIAELTDFNDVDKCLSILLYKVQEHVIGYRKDINNNWVCIVENNDSIIKTYKVMTSFGLATDYLPNEIEYNNVALFPDGKKLSDMVKEPLDFHEWTKENLI